MQIWESSANDETQDGGSSPTEIDELYGKISEEFFEEINANLTVMRILNILWDER